MDQWNMQTSTCTYTEQSKQKSKVGCIYDLKFIYIAPTQQSTNIKPKHIY